jgi:hypothetical protein
VKLDFTGAYSVIARNIHGEAKAVISLQVYVHGESPNIHLIFANRYGQEKKLKKKKRFKFFYWPSRITSKHFGEPKELSKSINRARARQKK